MLTSVISVFIINRLKLKIVAANDQGISEQTMYAFIKNNRLKHFEQNNTLKNAKKELVTIQKYIAAGIDPE